MIRHLEGDIEEVRDSKKRRTDVLKSCEGGDAMDELMDMMTSNAS